MKRSLVFAVGLLTCCCLAGCAGEPADTVKRVADKGTLVVALPSEGDSGVSREWAAALEQDVIGELADQMGVEIRYEYMDGPEAEKAVDDGLVDIAAGAVIEEESGNDGYSVTYGSRPVYLATAPGLRINSLGEMADQSIGFGRDMSGNVKDQFYSVTGLTIVDYNSADSARTHIVEGKIAGYVCYEAEARKFLEEGGLEVCDLPAVRQETYAFYAGKTQYRVLGELNRLITEKLKD